MFPVPLVILVVIAIKAVEIMKRHPNPPVLAL
jgi:hypothetical protein